MTRVYRVAAVAVLAALLHVGLAYGQAATATIRGLVRDSQGRPVPSATVTVVGRGTGLSRVVPTGEDGAFVVANLPPIVVDLRVTASGFGDATHGNIVLEVGQAVTVDITLAVAGVREQVDVAATTTGVDTTRSVVDAVIPAAAIEALPLNGRNFLELALLVPGNAPAPNFDPTKTNTVVISSAGQLGRGGNVTIDGADNNDDVVGGPLQNVTQESVQEFQIATNRFSAETGRSGSSVINVVTKSGQRPARTARRRSSSATRSWQALPATYDRSSGDDAAVRSPAVSRGRSAGRSSPSKAFWFGAVEYRNQDGAVLVGARDAADAHDHAQLRAGAARRLARHRRASTGGRRTATRVDVPLFRRARDRHRRRARSTARSGRPRSGSASQNRYNSVVGHVDAHRRADAPERR